MSLPRYPTYKDSGVAWLGQAPASWELRRLGYYFSERREKVSDKDYPPLSVTKAGIVPQLETAAKTDDGDNRKLVRSGDFVINSRSDRKGSSGISQSDGSVSLINIVLVPAQWISGSFAHHLFRSIPFQEEYYRFGKGIVADLWSTNYSEMRNIVLAVPDHLEQVEIAAFLDRETTKIDALIAEQEKLIELLAEKRQATISHAVTRGLNPDAPLKDSAISWLGGVPVHWAVGGMTRFIGPVVDYRGRTPTKGEKGMFLVTAKNVRNGAIDYGASQEYVDPGEAAALLSRGAPEIGDVLFTTEAPLGQVAQIDRTDIALAQRIVKFRGIGGVLINDYLMFWLMSDSCQSRLETLATGSTALGIKASKLSMIECLVPPVEEQEIIVAFIRKELGKITELRSEAERAVDLLRERRGALVAAAVTGQIDVRDSSSPAHVPSIS